MSAGISIRFLQVVSHQDDHRPTIDATKLYYCVCLTMYDINVSALHPLFQARALQGASKV